METIAFCLIRSTRCQSENWGKFRFAMSLFSLFHILAIIGSAKDVYLEKFGADATAIGCLFSVAWSGEHDRAVFVPGSIDIYQQVVMLGFCWRSSRYSADLIHPIYTRNVESFNVAYFSSAERFMWAAGHLFLESFDWILGGPLAGADLCFFETLQFWFCNPLMSVFFNAVFFLLSDSPKSSEQLPVALFSRTFFNTGRIEDVWHGSFP